MPERVANDRFSTWTRTVVALHGRCLRSSTTVSPGEPKPSRVFAWEVC